MFRLHQNELGWKSNENNKEQEINIPALFITNLRTILIAPFFFL